MKVLNRMEKFEWAARSRKDFKLSKASIAGVEFWLGDCEPYGEGAMVGTVLNAAPAANLAYGELVIFEPTRET